MDSQSICNIVTVVVGTAVLIWGYISILRKQQPDEPDVLAVISRQLRGFGTLLLSTVILSVGYAVCSGTFGKGITMGGRGY